MSPKSVNRGKKNPNELLIWESTYLANRFHLSSEDFLMPSKG